jgi:hypothetical protein
MFVDAAVVENLPVVEQTIDLIAAQKKYLEETKGKGH